MTGPVVLVTSDIPLGRTCVSYYLDEEEWQRGNRARTRRLTLSWFATHRVESGLLVPIPGRAA